MGTDGSKAKCGFVRLGITLPRATDRAVHFINHTRKVLLSTCAYFGTGVVLAFCARCQKGKPKFGFYLSPSRKQKVISKRSNELHHGRLILHLAAYIWRRMNAVSKWKCIRGTGLYNNSLLVFRNTIPTKFQWLHM